MKCDRTRTPPAEPQPPGLSALHGRPPRAWDAPACQGRPCLRSGRPGECGTELPLSQLHGAEPRGCRRGAPAAKGGGRGGCHFQNQVAQPPTGVHSGGGGGGLSPRVCGCGTPTQPTKWALVPARSEAQGSRSAVESPAQTPAEPQGPRVQTQVCAGADRGQVPGAPAGWVLPPALAAVPPPRLLPFQTSAPCCSGSHLMLGTPPPKWLCNPSCEGGGALPSPCCQPEPGMVSCVASPGPAVEGEGPRGGGVSAATDLGPLRELSQARPAAPA